MSFEESAVRLSFERHATDRRDYPRASLQAPVLLDNLKSWHQARCRDVSVTGISVTCDERLEVGEQVEIYFELPSGVAVETRARVVRRDASALALAFVELDTEARRAIRAHCRAREASLRQAAALS